MVKYIETLYQRRLLITLYIILYYIYYIAFINYIILYYIIWLRYVTLYYIILYYILRVHLKEYSALPNEEVEILLPNPSKISED
jgi:hypothetical protein